MRWDYPVVSKGKKGYTVWWRGHLWAGWWVVLRYPWRKQGDQSCLGCSHSPVCSFLGKVIPLVSLILLRSATVDGEGGSEPAGLWNQYIYLWEEVSDAKAHKPLLLPNACSPLQTEQGNKTVFCPCEFLHSWILAVLTEPLGTHFKARDMSHGPDIAIFMNLGQSKWCTACPHRPASSCLQAARLNSTGLSFQISSFPVTI